jgi:GNAT superfamily N-acetyltransferase
VLQRAATKLRTFAHDERQILLLKVDLTNPKNRLRPRDQNKNFRLLPFDKTTLPPLLEILKKHEPWRVAAARRRYLEGARGFVAEHNGRIVGHVFFVEGTDHGPHRLIHSDLRWLGLHPKRGELYTFDYFVIEPERGLGQLFARSVQDEQHRLGYTAAYGWVLQSNRAALWLYRTIGWVDVGRVVEHRLFTRWVVVGRTLYWMRAHSRMPIVELPSLLTPRSPP